MPHQSPGSNISARLGTLQCSSGELANADFDKVLAKEPGAEDVVVALPWRADIGKCASAR
ncbi:hypothetical protein NKI19_31245 [Mesorhizobium sp. M0751]|uniref:hypothetical protein n=1 Tax=Mesorhizobium sp. M0751 TaxID=2956992 RepID=UPI00333629B0